ncbi:peptidylprolyl isomerase [Ponticoccus sp. SC2-23]|uniref:peptidylprolyl isomerase n=1 Tax=Alexandriicola marinus TaxID=2081710 RepID=UPI000FD87BD7|nr:peptidylprolyl isomerase [Alexandriicola marinus]MBM1220679.1 peptidylprolyl isomerase [Ponticoccus sp. SC6-9]MBM1225938.1 peptidylprolyl isomerase [Ponticoccus sp. SC6-15]MBM1231235.1 peptidylprolyl isomerase [Ponticoccus sp. SC6-38]MBM1235904.1 peptidylprolyl isomerase [Ponticoccus sp. SC6-45]MBM1240258.1 peptidylprolyl isomerase [Ponticoccus sp. SC6-49]MBM1244793.1 peptidylprolyl isomerase [Ponticoccus sp. SC2-64]MBM1249378.1 peptidylprolyl isomerase [Ponticoccus sp. SC6-42]MBM1252334
MQRLTASLTGSVLALFVAGAVAAQDAPNASDVVATVNGTQITLGQMIITRSQLPPQYQQLPDEVLFNGVLDQLIQQQVLADTLDEEPLRVTLALENERRSLLAGEVVNQINTDSVTEDGVMALYDEMIADMGPAVEYNAAHILVETEEEALAVISRLEAGEDFAELARELSTDFGSGANGGDLGWFGTGVMVPPFEEAVLSLEEGEVSSPVETQFGFHIVTLKETRDVTPPALDQVRAELEAELRQRAIQDRLASLLDSAEIARPEAGAFDPAVLQDLTLLEE